MKIFVIGCGPIGERHIKNLLRLKESNITAIDIDRERLKYLEREYGISANHFSDLANLLKKHDKKISLICMPNHLHIKVASLCVKHKSHIFIEKPLAHTNEGISALKAMAKEKGRISMIACNLRFSPIFKQVKKCLEEGVLGRPFWAKAEYGLYLPSWRPTKDYRKNYGAKREEGGGALLDLYHEFDYLHWFFGVPQKVLSVYRKLSDLEINTEDSAEVILEYGTEKPLICNLHVDYVQYKYIRSGTIVGDKAMITWNWGDQSIYLWDVKGRLQKEFNFKGYDGNSQYVDEMKYFLDCVRKRKRCMTDIGEAEKIQSVIFRAKESGKKERMVRV